MNIFDTFFGDIDENKEYFTDDMLAQEIGNLLLYILLDKKLITKDELREYKDSYKDYRNKQMIEEMKSLRNAK